MCPNGTRKRIVGGENANPGSNPWQVKNLQMVPVALLSLNVWHVWCEPAAKSYVLGVNAFLEGRDFCFCYKLKTKFSGHSKMWSHCPRMPPVTTGLVW